MGATTSGSHKAGLEVTGLYFEGDGHVGVAVAQTIKSSAQVTAQVATEEAGNTEIEPLPDMDQLVDDEKAQSRPVPVESSRIDKDPARQGHRLDAGAPDPHHQRRCRSEPHLFGPYRVDENPQLVDVHT